VDPNQGACLALGSAGKAGTEPVYDIKLTPDAFDDLHSLRRLEQKDALSGIKAQLSFEPTVETRNRKRLRPNALAEWELRIREVRVFYDVDEQAGIIKVEAIGCKKGSRLFIRGEEYEL
jgi:mRNA-degrading endonuclease RelE of RelBE toxin-antitoxin system